MVKGAKGEGLGKQFLGNIRNTNAIIRVLHCFEDDNITHVGDIPSAKVLKISVSPKNTLLMIAIIKAIIIKAIQTMFKAIG